MYPRYDTRITRIEKTAHEERTRWQVTKKKVNHIPKRILIRERSNAKRYLYDYDNKIDEEEGTKIIKE